MRKIIDYIIEQEFETTDNYPSLVKPISEKFNIELDVAEKIVNEVIEWEGSGCVECLELRLKRLFPDIVTN